MGLTLLLLHYFDGAEYLVHHLGDDGVAVGFEGFGAPFAERNGKVVHIKGKPIISSVNRGDSRKPLPASTSCDITIFATSSSKLAWFRSAIFGLLMSHPFTLLALGVGKKLSPNFSLRLAIQ